ncbi:hypothetical protein COUCH_25105 [Couchioplanes caeruleus]|uniref:DUF3885 domain-containing protein n=1 Tax=Couchioplanes caeruleus TaxID=56438 RepID=UPI0020C14D34|nr:hypothetical protein [Couchioplanes caeruleus]UQU62303.1 hypothetical protein COUCH_25105 [Couchioplanes caeruleus]
MVAGWRTLAEISRAFERYESNLGWQRPRLHGIGFVEGADEISFVRVNDDEDVLAAAVLATVTGWHGSTGSVRLGKSKLAKAIKRLTPADACREADRANLRIWREIHGWSWIGEYVRGGNLIAVFDADPQAPSEDPYVVALRQVIASGRQSVPPDDVWVWPPPSGRHPLQDAWEARWPHLEPIGSRLRQDTDGWVRFHSLPGSKRYAEVPSEYTTILHRHNIVLHELGAQSCDLLVITSQLAFTPTPERRDPALSDLLPDAECWLVLSWPHLDPTLAYAHAYVSRIRWQPGRLDELLRKVADDEIDDVIITPSDLAWLYAPYDGGADVILSSPELRDDLRDRHRDWLSRHPSGH